MAEGQDATNGYGTFLGFIYLFNLIVGTGSLNLPYAFSLGGYVLASVFLCALAFTSFINCTYINETMAIANYFRRLAHNSDSDSVGIDNMESLNEPLLRSENSVEKSEGRGESNTNAFAISERIEIGQCAQMFFSKGGVLAMYICMIAYLYGDLSIYAIVISKSITEVACEGWEHSKCFGDKVPGLTTYRMFTMVFLCMVAPFCFMNLSKTKYLQAVTSFLRWTSFTLMIVVALVGTATNNSEAGPFHGTPIADLNELPSLIGISIYAFMCHHSLPGLMTPIRNKKNLNSMIGSAYVIIVLFYLLLCFSAVSFFDATDIKSVYTLNFSNIEFLPHAFARFVKYFVTLFPVLTLSTTFPIIASTLVGNIVMVLPHEVPWYVKRVVIPLVAIVPPFSLALATQDVKTVATITGAFPGLGIQYIIPMSLGVCARRRLRRRQVRGAPDRSRGTGSPTAVINPHASAFGHTAWLAALSAWSAFCLVFVGYNFFVHI